MNYKEVNVVNIMRSLVNLKKILLLKLKLSTFQHEETFRLKNSKGEIIDLNYFGDQDKKKFNTNI